MFFELKYLKKIFFFPCRKSVGSDHLSFFSAEEGEKSVLHMSVGLKLSWCCVVLQLSTAPGSTAKRDPSKWRKKWECFVIESFRL